MTASFYVVFSAQGFVSAYKTDKFTMKSGEFATQVELDIPDEAFRPMPIPKAVIRIPVEAIQRVYEAELEGESDE